MVRDITPKGPIGPTNRANPFKESKYAAYTKIIIASNQLMGNYAG